MAITNLDYDEDDLDETGPSGPTQRPVITEDMAKVLASEDHRMRYYSSLTATDAQPVDLLTLLGHRPAWHADALCREYPGVSFYPERGQPTGPAKAICGRCAVRQDCEAAARANAEEFGVWGGLSAQERRVSSAAVGALVGLAAGDSGGSDSEQGEAGSG